MPITKMTDKFVKRIVRKSSIHIKISHQLIRKKLKIFWKFGPNDNFLGLEFDDEQVIDYQTIQVLL